MSERASRSEIRRRHREEGTPMGGFAIRNTAMWIEKLRPFGEAGHHRAKP